MVWPTLNSTPFSGQSNELGQFEVGSDQWKSAWHRRSPRAPSSTSPAAECSGQRSNKLARLEAVLLVADAAVSARKLTQWATLADTTEAEQLIDQLNAFYEADGSAFRVESVASGYRLMTRSEFAPWLDRLHRREAHLKLSPPAMETLTAIAYHQPVTRAEVESIRGVQSAEMIRMLMERGLVRITGEEDSLGRPYLYGTTRQFLEAFGLKSIEELPAAA